MESLSSGTSVTLNIVPGQTLVVQSDSSPFRVENPLGTIQGEYTCDSAFGPFTAGAPVKLTCVSGSINYELASQDPASTITFNKAVLSNSNLILGLIGDSRIAQSYSTAGLAPTTRLRAPPSSIAGWACFLSNNRIRSGSAYNKAVSGSLVAAVDGQFTNLLSVYPRPTHVLVLTGTNSFGVGVTGSTAWAQLAPVLARIRDAGMQAIVMMDLPRAVSSWTTAAAQNSFWFNQLIRQNAAGVGAWVVDASKYIADPASATGDPLSNYYYDTTHPATSAAYYAGKEICDAILSRITVPNLPGFTSRGDVYNATNNPLGNCISYGLFSGTGGTNTSSGGTASGTVADGWTNRTLTGTGTSVASIVARTDKAGNWQQLVQTSGSGTSTYRFSLTSNPAVTTNFPASGSLVLEADIDVSSATGLEALGFSIYGFDGAAQLDGVECFGSTLLGATYYPLPAAFSGRIRTEPLPYNSLSTALLVRLETQINTGAATIKVGNVEVRPV